MKLIVFTVIFFLFYLQWEDSFSQTHLHFEGSSWELAGYGPIDTTDLEESEDFFWSLMILVQSQQSSLVFNFNKKNKLDITNKNNRRVKKGSYQFYPKRYKLVIDLRDKQWKYKVSVLKEDDIKLISKSQNAYLRLKRRE
ncbi:MAG: hypothetical protein BRD50_08460 [Bacteroidetes bacterium SW_11_45_7]|nr:MAG: hypothetical protein BRD50_08460 [Bacteroidetes bacterium SW_11_45_7]